MIGRLTLAGLLILGLGGGLLGGYLLWGRQPNWYAGHDVFRLQSDPQDELVLYGRDLVVNTAKHIGPEAPAVQIRAAGNNLACTNCHLNAGLQPFAAPFVSTFSSYPMIVDDRYLTLPARINGCMTRSMNGKPLPETSREMDAFVSYIRFVGKGTPQDVRVAGMGLRSLPKPKNDPDTARGEALFATACARCHGSDGLGQKRLPPEFGYRVPPLWGDDSFNTAAGMSDLPIAAAFIHAKMPLFGMPELSEQQAWDLAAFIVSRPRPQMR